MEALVTCTEPFVEAGLVRFPCESEKSAARIVIAVVPMAFALNVRLIRVPLPEAAGVANWVQASRKYPGSFCEKTTKRLERKLP